MTSSLDESITAISDPGEKNHDSHIWGDKLMINIGNAVAWIFPILMFAIVTQVIIRKMGFNQAWLDDAQWWMYGFAMLTGFGYAITINSHVRVDIFHQHFSASKAAKIEIFALGWLLLPFLVMMTDIMFHYGWASIVAREGSDSPNGLHMLFLLKSSIPILFVAAIIATCSALYRNLAVVTPVATWKLIIAALPACWFLAARAVYYILWWFVWATEPDLVTRKIGKEPIMEWTVWYGLFALIFIALVTLGLSRRAGKE